ncbi:MAG: efflux RND transporter permease subunit [Marinilabiliaceae bacterium]|nr:efflux RND transporter permease subunit [Marinilabiliaceae bacterium]
MRDSSRRYILSPFAVLITAICLTLIGWSLLPLLPLSLEPAANRQTLYVTFSMNGATSQVVETQVTSRLEAALARMENVEGIMSITNNGYGQIVVDISKRADIEMARFEASSIIRQLWSEMPQGVTYPSVEISQTGKNASTSFIVYTINAEAPSSEIKRVVQEHFQSSFSDIKGVSNVEISGAEPLEWKLEYDANQLNELGITLQSVTEAISGNRQTIKRGHVQIATDAPDEGLELRDITVVTPDTTHISLDKLMTLTHEEAEPLSYYRINGANSIYMRFSANEDANQLALASKVKKRVAELCRSLPSSYQVQISYDATEHISEELDKIYLRSGITILLLILFVFLVTLSWRYVVTVVIGIIFNISISIVLYYFAGVELQLYSLAALTISLNMIIDNIIIVIEHLKRERNLQVILPILAATLTTIGALSVILFLDSETQQNLRFFAIVLAINLLVSIVVAVVVVPALLSFIGIERKEKERKAKLSLIKERIAEWYSRFISISVRYRGWFIVVLILIFGLPVFMLPQRIDEEKPLSSWYNNTIGSEMYQNTIKPVVDVALGGTLRLFVDKVSTGGYMNRDRDVVLHIFTEMPDGTTMDKMNDHVVRMETLLKEYKEISQFETTIRSPQIADIAVRFKEQYRHTGFPYQLKNTVVSKSLQLGGGSWSVYGLEDQGFSNDVKETDGTYYIRLMGYNYSELLTIADSLCNRLKSHKRIAEVAVKSEYTWYKDNYYEYCLEPDKEKLAQNGITPDMLYSSIIPLFVRELSCGMVWSGDASERVTLTSRQAKEMDLWYMENMLVDFYGKSFRIKDLCRIEKKLNPRAIRKEDQQYIICLQYEYMGSSKGGIKNHKAVIEQFRPMMPAGYELINDMEVWYSSGANSGYIWLVLFVIVVILFITSILFNSHRYSFIVLSLLPLTFVGVFTTYYLFNVRFDLGGVTAFILLCGITINSAIYIINEYKRQQVINRENTLLDNYLRAFKAKIVAIMLTIISTVLGFVPFVIGTSHETFWYSLSMGVIGGLIFSIVGLVLFLPLFSLSKRKI